MTWPTRSQKIYLELLTGWLRTETEKLNNVLVAIEDQQEYHNEYVYETIKSAEIALRQMRKFIDAN